MYFPSGCKNALQALTALSPECIDGQRIIVYIVLFVAFVRPYDR